MKVSKGVRKDYSNYSIWLEGRSQGFIPTAAHNVKLPFNYAFIRLGKQGAVDKKVPALRFTY